MRGELWQIVIKDSKLLILKDINNSPTCFADKFSTYAKVTLFSADQKVKSKKSAVVTNDRNPIYDHGFTFHLAGKSRDEIFVVVSVMLKGLLKKDTAIGRLIIGPSCYAEGHILTPWGRAVLYEESVSHWFRMYLWFDVHVIVYYIYKSLSLM